MADPRPPDDISSYINDLLSGTRSTGEGYGAGPVSAWSTESRSALATPPWQRDMGPSRSTDVGIGQDIGSILGIPLSAFARLNATQYPGGDHTLTPTLGAKIGALSGRFSRDYDKMGEESKATDRFGAGLEIPIGKGQAGAYATLTPEQQLQNYLLQLSYPLSPSSVIGMLLSHSRGGERTPDTRFGVGYQGRF